MVELNILYRFHSPLSKCDADWTKRFLQAKLYQCKLQYSGSDEDRVSEDQFKNGDIPLPALQKVLRNLYEENSIDRNMFVAPPRYLRVDKDNETDAQVSKDKVLSYNLNRDPITYKFNDKDLILEMASVMQNPIC